MKSSDPLKSHSYSWASLTPTSITYKAWVQNWLGECWKFAMLSQLLHHPPTQNTVVVDDRPPWGLEGMQQDSKFDQKKKEYSRLSLILATRLQDRLQEDSGFNQKSLKECTPAYKTLPLSLVQDSKNEQSRVQIHQISLTLLRQPHSNIQHWPCNLLELMRRMFKIFNTYTNAALPFHPSHCCRRQQAS